MIKLGDDKSTALCYPPMGVSIVNRKYSDQGWAKIPHSNMDGNWWHWRTVVELLRPSEILSSHEFDLMSDGCFEFDRDKALSIASYLRTYVISKAAAGVCIFPDGSTSSAPDDGTFHKEPEEQHKNYSANLDWLEKFVRFLEDSDGIYVC